MKAKVNDKVKILKASTGQDESTIGKIGTVTSVCSTDVFVKFEDCDGWYYMDHEYEIID